VPVSRKKSYLPGGISFFYIKFILPRYNVTVQSKTKILAIATFIAAYLAVFFYSQAFGIHTTNQLQVSFLDVGQGDAIYIKAPNGNDMLIDGGRSSTTLTKKLKNVMAPGDGVIDIVLATHPDADHIGGLHMVLEKYSVGEFIEPGVPASSKLYTSLESDLVQHRVPQMLARTGMEIILDAERGISFTVLAPFTVYEGEDTNDASIVGILSYGEQTFMLTGDAGVAAETEIIENKNSAINLPTITADVLKLGHHGSRTSSSEAFLKATNSSVAIISAGCDNSYGHPHKEVTDRLARFQIPTLSTCISGTITFTTDGKTLSTKTEK
jgi:beta-lactamase superfamily II metal-dependent hydrolase